MEVTLATLADWAATTDQGKLVIGGVFDTIRVRGLPTRHPMMTLALRMSAPPGEAPSHEVVVRLVDPDGDELIPEIKGRVDLPQNAPAEGGSMQIVLHLPGVAFTKTGPHGIDIFVDGRHVKSMPLHVVKVGPPEESTDEVPEDTKDEEIPSDED